MKYSRSLQILLQISGVSGVLLPEALALRISFWRSERPTGSYTEVTTGTDTSWFTSIIRGWWMAQKILLDILVVNA